MSDNYRVTIKVTEMRTHTKTYDADDLRHLIHVKGGSNQTLIEFVYDHKPDEVLYDLRSTPELSGGPTWHVFGVLEEGEELT